MICFAAMGLIKKFKFNRKMTCQTHWLKNIRMQIIFDLIGIKKKNFFFTKKSKKKEKIDI
jgi:hypothetical protein